tara:strand:- start:57 stop:365 length:309 start_codon:yes stop_codon:yes gene_type:complete
MKLTETRIKEIIREEVESLNEQEPQAQQNTEDDTKTLQQLKAFLVNLSKQVTQIKGASAPEVKASADLIIKMFKAFPKGEIGRFIKFADDQLTKKLGENNER